MKKCAICNKEINGGFLVEIECLKELQKDLKRQTDIKDKLKEHNAELKRIIKADLKKIEELVAENEQLQTENAEKLLWLANCADIEKKTVDVERKRLFCSISYRKFKSFHFGKGEDYKDLSEAINAAYNWAKEQE